MFSDPVSFSGDTRVEVITVLANCGRDTDRARRALVTWIRHKQDKGRSTEHILVKLRDIESKFIKDTTLHSAFRDARAETFLPRAPDLPLPSSIRRRSSTHTSESASVYTPSSLERGSIDIHSNLTQRISPPVSPLRSQLSEVLPGRSNPSQRISLPPPGLRVPQSRTPRIQIPRDLSIQPGPSSPVTSSPEEPQIHFRYRYMSQPVGRSNGFITPDSTGTSELPLSLAPSRDHPRRRLSHTSPPPSIRIPIPLSPSQRSVPISPPTPSSDESDFYPRRYRPLSQPVGSSIRRLTPPRSSPPDVPLPPIPSNDQGMDLDSDKKSFYAERLPTPVRALALQSTTPTRPLPIQPIPSPVPGSDESEEPTDLICGNSLRHDWEGSNGDLPSDIVVRQDSPVYVFHHDHATSTGIDPPPPYIEQLDTYFPADMATIGDSLDRIVNEYGGSPEVRLVVSRCIEFYSGYEPPYWQSRLQACGLDAEEARHLVDEMSRQVDWAASFRKGI